MKKLALYLVLLAGLIGCKKDTIPTSDAGSGVELYLLKSYTTRIDSSSSPFRIILEDIVLEEQPLVHESDIDYYQQSTTTFKFRTDLGSAIRNLNATQAFAVTLNKQIVYSGLVHPGYYSYFIFGFATIDPILYHNNELMIQFVNFTGSNMGAYDLRNASNLINALKAAGKYRN